MIPATLVLGGDAQARERLIAADLPREALAAALLEGLPPTDTPLEERSGLLLVRLLAGCPCCAGNLALRVHLNRMLRQRPAALYIALASPGHAAEFRRFLETAPYKELLSITKELHAECRSQ